MTANFTQPHGLLDYWRDMLISLDYWPCQADSLSPCDICTGYVDYYRPVQLCVKTIYSKGNSGSDIVKHKHSV